MALWLTIGAWTAASAAAVGGSAGPVIAVLAVCATGYVVGRLAASARAWFVPLSLLGVVTLIAFAAGPEIVSSSPTRGPLGYANARAALFLEAGIASAMLAVVARSALGTVLGWIAAFISIVLVFMSGSLGAAVFVPGLAGAALLTRWFPVRWMVTACGLVFIGSLTGTVALGAVGGSGAARLIAPPGTEVEGSARRISLWNEAFDMMVSNPFLGVGPGRFREVSFTSRSDADAAWAHHGFLQHGAETGVLGFVSLVSLFLWGFLRLFVEGAHGSGTSLVPLAGLSLTALGGQACVDYIFHFPLLPAFTALLVGAAIPFSISGAKRRSANGN